LAFTKVCSSSPVVNGQEDRHDALSPSSAVRLTVVGRRGWRHVGARETVSTYGAVTRCDEKYASGAKSSTTGVLQILAELEGPRVWGRKLLEAPDVS